MSDMRHSGFVEKQSECQETSMQLSLKVYCQEPLPVTGTCSLSPEPVAYCMPLLTCSLVFKNLINPLAKFYVMLFCHCVRARLQKLQKVQSISHTSIGRFTFVAF
jgi:hypothetical protein